MLFALGAISVFLIGGLTGPPLGTVTTDLQLHDTYYVVGHFHATMFGGFVFPFFAALVLLVPEGNRPDVQREAGRAALCADDAGLLGDEPGPDRWPARVACAAVSPTTTRPGASTVGQMLVTIAGFVIAFSVLIMVINLIVQRPPGTQGGCQPVALTWSGVADPIARAGAQLCLHSYRGGRALRLRLARINLRAVCAGHDRRRLGAQPRQPKETR